MIRKTNDKAEIMSSSEADSRYIHEKLKEYNAQYMHKTEDFNFHIEGQGKISNSYHS